MLRSVLFLLGLLVCLSATEATAMNILLNSSFEDALDPNNEDIPLNWTVTPGEVERTDEIPGHTGDHTIKVGIGPNAFVFGSQLHEVANLGGKTVTAGVWGLFNESNYDNNSILKMEFFAGGPGGALLGSKDVFWNPPTINTWAYQELSEVAPAGAGKVVIQLMSTGFANGNIYFDDASLTVVPEPSTALLAGFGLLGLVRRRKETH